MPLPGDADAARPWPPPSVERYVKQQKEWAAWWGGDVAKLRARSAESRFWHRLAAEDAERRNGRQTRALHAAVAADIVTTSADLLFGEPVEIVIPQPEATGDQGEQVDADEQGIDEGRASLAQEAAAVDLTQARLDELRDDIDLDGLMLEAAETAAALGGAWLRPAWDTAVAEHPLLTIVDPEYAVPEYTFRRLTAVTFWQEVDKEGEGATAVVWRHLERHEWTPAGGGIILHGLYRGDPATLGKAQPLTAKVATAGLAPEVKVPAAVGRVLPSYMPNVTPNRKHRKLPIGRSDFDGIENELDAIDETWTALLRDIRLGVARIFAPEGTLERVAPGAGSGRTFNVDRELIVETDASADEGMGARVVLMQGDIRDASLLATVRALVEQAVSAAGYAPATFGLGIDGAAESGTARAIRERKTFRTLNRKRRKAERAISDVCHALLAIDAEIFQRPGVVPMRPRIGWPDVTAEPRTTAERLQMLRVAQAISIRNAVHEAQPDLSPTEIDEEVARIMAENSVTDPDRINLDRPGAGAPAGGAEPDDLEPDEDEEPAA